MKKIVLVAVSIIAFLVLLGSSCDRPLDKVREATNNNSSCDRPLDKVREANNNAVAANGFVLITDYQDWLNGNVIYYLYCTDTDVMYIEYCTSGYNSAVVPIYKPDGTMLTYSEWIEKR